MAVVFVGDAIVNSSPCPSQSAVVGGSQHQSVSEVWQNLMLRNKAKFSHAAPSDQNITLPVQWCSGTNRG